MNEFRKDGDHILINVPYAEAYLPVSLFTDSESSVAYFTGDAVQVLGLFHMRFFESDEEAEDRDSKHLCTFKYPNSINTHPTSFEKMKLTINNIEDTYYVLQYYMDDIMMDSHNVQSVLNCEAYMDCLIKAKFPETIDYQDFLLNWVKNFSTNGIDPGTKAVVMQLIISENVRYAKDPRIPFRKVAAKMDTIKPEDYVMYNMNNISANNSVLSGIGFERVKEKIGTSITMSMSGAKQNVSPLEKVMLM